MRMIFVYHLEDYVSYRNALFKWQNQSVLTWNNVWSLIPFILKCYFSSLLPSWLDIDGEYLLLNTGSVVITVHNVEETTGKWSIYGLNCIFFSALLSKYFNRAVTYNHTNNLTWKCHYYEKGILSSLPSHICNTNNGLKSIKKLSIALMIWVMYKLSETAATIYSHKISSNTTHQVNVKTPTVMTQIITCCILW